MLKYGYSIIQRFPVNSFLLLQDLICTSDAKIILGISIWYWYLEFNSIKEFDKAYIWRHLWVDRFTDENINRRISIVPMSRTLCSEFIFPLIGSNLFFLSTCYSSSSKKKFFNDYDVEIFTSSWNWLVVHHYEWLVNCSD